VAISTMTSKGQVTIPKKLRDRLELRPGDKLDFRLEEDGTLRVHRLERRVEQVFGAFAHKAETARSPEEIDAELRASLEKGRT